MGDYSVDVGIEHVRCILRIYQRLDEPDRAMGLLHVWGRVGDLAVA
jgi:hypothetical protein